MLQFRVLIPVILMILKDSIHIIWKIYIFFLHYFVKLYLLLYSWEMTVLIIHMCQETHRHFAGWFHLLFWTNTSTHLELVTQNILVIWIRWFSCSFRLLEQSAISSYSIPVRKVLIKISIWTQHIVHPVLQMWMASNVNSSNLIHSTVAKLSRIVWLPYDANKRYQ